MIPAIFPALIVLAAVAANAYDRRKARKAIARARAFRRAHSHALALAQDPDGTLRRVNRLDVQAALVRSGYASRKDG